MRLSKMIHLWLEQNPAEWGATIQWRIGKLVEEVGEVQAALIATAGQNPRKPATDSFDDVVKELADVVITAQAALEYFHQADRNKYGTPDEEVEKRGNVIAARITDTGSAD
jgi:hypothetical protein